MPFQDMRSSRILTFQILLHDEPGSLNKLLSTFTNHQANIMTINSIVPTNGSAVVTIAAETVNLEIPLEDLLEEFRQVPGVIKADVLAG
jgi:chorismate mutase